MHPLEQKIRGANSQGRIALIPFITANFPNPEVFRRNLAELEQTADIIELGIPFSDPVADGPVVEQASRRVLANGFILGDFLRDLQSHKPAGNAAYVLMGYYNPFLQYGFDKLARDAAAAGVTGMIIPDLPYNEAQPARDALRKEGIALIPLVGPNTGAARMALYAANAEGYVYVVSVLGTTGERKSLADNVSDVIDRTRSVFHIPVALGFGLKTPDQLQVLRQNSRPDAVVFGSALLRHIDSGKNAASFMAAWL